MSLSRQSCLNIQSSSSPNVRQFRHISLPLFFSSPFLLHVNLGFPSSFPFTVSPSAVFRRGGDVFDRRLAAVTCAYCLRSLVSIASVPGAGGGGVGALGNVPEVAAVVIDAAIEVVVAGTVIADIVRVADTAGDAVIAAAEDVRTRGAVSGAAGDTPRRVALRVGWGGATEAIASCHVIAGAPNISCSAARRSSIVPGRCEA